MSWGRRWLGVTLGFLGGLVLIFSSESGVLQGQPKLPEIKPAPQGPVLTTPANLGVRVGEKNELTLSGTSLNEPLSVLCTCPGVTAVIPADGKNGTNPAQLRVQITVPADSAIGVYGLRLATRHGVSNIRPLVVDELPVVVEKDGNKSKAGAQPIPTPVVVVGQIEAESSDFYRISVQPGQRLTVEVLARRIGSPLDPLLILHDAKTQRELIHLSADDTPGLQRDCRLTHTFTRGGDYLIEVRDSTWRGGADFHYRLRIADCPGAMTAFPLAVQRGVPATIGFTGPGSESWPPVRVIPPSDPTLETVSIAPRYREGSIRGWPVSVRLHDWPETTEHEPNDTPAQAQSLPIPGGVSARFEKNGDLDYFRITGKKGQKLAAIARTFEFLSPADAFIRVLDAKGKELTRSNPAQSTARAEWTIPEDGDYLVVCEHLNYRGGASEVYHLSVLPATGDFTLSCTLDRVEAASGGRTAMIVSVNRLEGFSGAIDLEVVGSEVVRGAVTVPASQSFAVLPLELKTGTPPGIYPFRVRGRAQIGERMLFRYASFVDLFKAGWGNMSHPPLELAGQCAAAVVQPAFSLAVVPEPPLVFRGKNGKLNFTVTRDKNADADILISPVFLPPNIATTPPSIQKGKTHVSAELKVAANAPTGAQTLLFRGSSKLGGKDYVVLAPAVIEVQEPAKEGKKEPVNKETSK